MSTKTQQHKSKTAQIACAVAVYALAPIQSALGVTAADRFRAMQNLNNDSGVMKNRWFTVAMLLIIAGSITALIIVTLYRKLREGRRQKTKDRGRKTEYRIQKTEDRIQKTEDRIQNTELRTQNSKFKTVDIEQRVSNIEKQVSAIENRLTNLEQEVSSFEVIEDESNVIQASANTEEGTK
jgi:septal ring factor EnvC (AmiA/AmiB activator)